MITEKHWIDFITDFFDVKAPQEWIHHVISNWNHLKNEPGCACSYIYYEIGGEANMCNDYVTAMEHTMNLSNTNQLTIDDEEPYSLDSFKSE